MKKRRFISLLMAIVIFFTMANFNSIVMYASENKETNTIKYENFDVTTTITDKWDTGYNAMIELINTSDTVIENWEISFAWNDTINNIWNANIERTDGNIYYVKNAGWNQDIQPGAKVEFGIGISCAFSEFPDDFKLTGSFAETSDKDYSIEIIVHDKWAEGLNSEVTITNLSESMIEDWIVEFDYPNQILNIWNAEIISYEGDHYVIKNKDYNANIESGKTISFGFIGSNNSGQDKPVNTTLYSYNSRIKEPISSVEDIRITVDTDGFEIYTYEGNEYYLVEDEINMIKGTVSSETAVESMSYRIKDYFGNVIKHGDIPVNTEWTIEDVGLTLGYNDLEIYVKTNTNEYISNILYNNLCEQNMNRTDVDREDNDKDGISNYYEDILGFDKNNNDTDGDGHSDFEEFGSDEDEINIYDQNSYLYDEPRNQICELEINEAERTEITKVSVNLECREDIKKIVTIKNTYGVDGLSSNVAGIVGVPIDIYCSKTFDEATIVFYYNEDYLGNTDEDDLSIMWYDRVNNHYILLTDSVVDKENNTISYTTTHFSTYLVVDTKKWSEVWNDNSLNYSQDIEQLEKSKHLADTGTIYKCYETGMTWDNAKAYCAGKGGHLATITSSQEQLIIESLMRDEGDKNSYWLGAEKDANSKFSQWITGEQMIYTHYKPGQPDNKDEKVLMIYRNNNPYSSGQCFGYWNDIFEDGNCKNEPFFGPSNFGFICEWNNVDLRDSDGDGLYDRYEKDGMQLPNGQIIYSDPLNADSPSIMRGKTSKPEIVFPMGHENNACLIFHIADENKEYIRYDRDAAIAYAEKWADEGQGMDPVSEYILAKTTGWGRNPDYYSYRTNCANFVSQCLRAGGMTDNTGWYYKSQDVEHEIKDVHGFTIMTYTTKEYVDSSDSWRLASAQCNYFGNSGNGFTDNPVIIIRNGDNIADIIKNNNIEKGDLMYFLDENGDAHHATIISKVSENEINYAGNTRRRYSYSLQNSFNDGEKAVKIIHISDSLLQQ